MQYNKQRKRPKSAMVDCQNCVALYVTFDFDKSLLHRKQKGVSRMGKPQELVTAMADLRLLALGIGYKFVTPIEAHVTQLVLFVPMRLKQKVRTALLSRKFQRSVQALFRHHLYNTTLALVSNGLRVFGSALRPSFALEYRYTNAAAVNQFREGFIEQLQTAIGFMGGGAIVKSTPKCTNATVLSGTVDNKPTAIAVSNFTFNGVSNPHFTVMSYNDVLRTHPSVAKKITGLPRIQQKNIIDAHIRANHKALLTAPPSKFGNRTFPSSVKRRTTPLEPPCSLNLNHDGRLRVTTATLRNGKRVATNVQILL